MSRPLMLICWIPLNSGLGDLNTQSTFTTRFTGIFLQTDNDKPSYGFYHKNGFKDLDSHISLYKRVKVD